MRGACAPQFLLRGYGWLRLITPNYAFKKIKKRRSTARNSRIPAKKGVCRKGTGMWFDKFFFHFLLKVVFSSDFGDEL
jgi:hypothetical protein